MTGVKKKEPVISGNLSSFDLKFLQKSLGELHAAYPKLVLSGDFQFLAARAAVKAGYSTDAITVADANLYSALIGGLITGSHPRYILSPDDEILMSGYLGANDSPARRAAFVMWVMKRAELAASPHLDGLLEDIDDRMVEHVDAMAESLSDLVASLGGITYRNIDVPTLIAEGTGTDTVTVVLRPVYTGRETKGFRYGGHITYDAGYCAYSWSREVPALYEASKQQPGLYIWSSPATYDAPSCDVVHAKEVRPDRVTRWLCTMPDHLGESIYLNSFSRRDYGPYPLPTWSLTDELKPDSVVKFVTASEGQVFYYRDLWAHKLGATAGDRYLLMIIDDKIYSAVIMNLSNFTHFNTDFIFEQSGFSAPSTRHPHLHRLLMWCLTSREFGDDIMEIAFKRNRLYVPAGLETTCISKYRKLKSNNGIFEVAFRERYPNGMYRIIYRAVFREEKYSDCIRRSLEEDVNHED